jgi:hypothetical protein
MRIKKFFKQSENSDIQDKIVPGLDELNFNSKPEFTGPVTRAMKKLLEQQNATNLAISALCDLSKKTLFNVRVGARMLRQSSNF